jgi:broad specificity phosphatase PhoE
LTSIYLVRHGQAGTRESYDSLSTLGTLQSRLLGEYFIAQGIEFAAAYVGGQTRQQQTAAAVRAAYAEAGAPFPELVIEQAWSEFNLDQIYREIAPQLCAEDPEFNRQYEVMREQVRANRAMPEAEVHRRWWPCDTKIVETWIAGRYSYTGETWEQFQKRVAACPLLTNHSKQRENVLVFTSATPAAIWTGLALEIYDKRLLRLAGVLRNASFTIVRIRQEDLRLFTFNAAPHLSSPQLQTHR